MKKCRSCGTPPRPYYANDVNSVTQDHATILRDTQFAAGVRIIDEFVVPAIDMDVQVNADNLVNVVVGSYLWNPAYGYLKIAHFDSCTGNLGLLNDDISGAAIPGTVVSADTLFAVTARPCCADQDNFSLFPFLAEDFVVPAVSQSVTLAVTSTFGLIEGTNVRIGSDVYLLDQINSSLEIVVTNQGGATNPGDTIFARDVNGDLQYLITQAVASACTLTGSDTVRLTGCDGATETILQGDFAGQVPVLQDPATEEVSFEFLDADVRVCTVLTAPMNITAATPNYTILVDDESIFSIGQILQIGSVNLRWEITDNTTPGHLDITCTIGAPGITTTVLVGSSVCVQLCCEGLAERVTTLEAEVINLQSEIDDLNAIIDDGWLPISNAGFYNAADVFEVSGDVTSKLKIGQKVRLLLNNIAFYGNIRVFAYESITPGRTAITIVVNTDYVLSNIGITFVEISHEDPPDFPPTFNYDVTPTSGFSGTSVKSGYYWLNDQTVNVRAVIVGTSNATDFIVPIPVKTNTAVTSVIGYAMGTSDNGTPLTTTGLLLASAYTMQVGKDASAASLTTWTNSGAKSGSMAASYPMDF